jgi:hypothetical protein
MKLNRISTNETEVILNEMLVDTTKHATVFFSYDTPVAAKVGTTYYRTSDTFSNTTSRHLNKWLEGVEATAKSQTWFEKLLFDVDHLSSPYMALR